MYRIGVDVGGTFTDLVAGDEAGRVVVLAKAASTPGDPSIGVLDGLTRLAEEGRRQLAHQPLRGPLSYPRIRTTFRPSVCGVERSA